MERDHLTILSRKKASKSILFVGDTSMGMIEDLCTIERKYMFWRVIFFNAET